MQPKGEIHVRSRIRLCLALTLSLLALSSATAWAETLIISPAREITLVSLGAITFETNVLGAHVACNVTLTGSLTTESFSSTRGTSIGSITRMSTSGCSGGTMTPLVEARAPWRIVYEAVDGAFPQEVTGYQMRLEGVRLLAEIRGFASCLVVGEVDADLATTYSELGSTEEDIVSRAGLARLQREHQSYSRVTRLGGTSNCPTEPSLLGTFSMEPQQSIKQAETFIQLGLPANITFTAVNQTRTVTLTNLHPKRTEQIDTVYTMTGNPERFRVLAGSTCRNATVLQPGGNGGGESCTISIEFTGPSPATSRLAVDLSTTAFNPAATGNLSG